MFGLTEEQKVARKNTRNGLDCDVENPLNAVQQANQGHRDETNVNKIVAAFEANGVNARVSMAQQSFGDFSDSVTLHEAYNLVHRSTEAFNALPAVVREVADNDPITFAQMAEHDGGLEILTAAGLIISDDESSDSEDPPQKPAAESGEEGAGAGDAGN